MTTKKKRALISISIMAFAGLIGHCAFCTYDYSKYNTSESDLLLENIEALASGEGTTISGCLGLWGACTLPDGTVFKAPAVEVGL